MYYDFFIAAIGASAGGLKAIKDFFTKVKVGMPIAYVVALHSKRDAQSNLVQILSRVTGVPVSEITQGLEIQPGNIYVHPPSMKVAVKQSQFILTQRPAIELINHTIDHLYTSLAEDAGDRTIGIIMSGTGSDGTKGFHAIEEHKGITIVQDPDTAEFDGMPQSSIKYDHPTYIAHPLEMSDIINRYVNDKLEKRHHVSS